MCLVCTATTDDAKAALLRRVALDCRSCPLLVLFPPGMTRLKRLICSSCPQLCALPEDMIHLTYLDCEECPNLGYSSTTSSFHSHTQSRSMLHAAGFSLAQPASWADGPEIAEHWRTWHVNSGPSKELGTCVGFTGLLPRTGDLAAHRWQRRLAPKPTRGTARVARRSAQSVHKTSGQVVSLVVSRVLVRTCAGICSADARIKL